MGCHLHLKRWDVTSVPHFLRKWRWQPNPLKKRVADWEPVRRWLVAETGHPFPREVRPLLDFVDSAVVSGASVLVHCLAGAHRAGTTGCLLLMYKADMDKRTAIASAKKLRPAIDPIGSLPEFLERYERAHTKPSVR